MSGSLEHVQAITDLLGRSVSVHVSKADPDATCPFVIIHPTPVSTSAGSLGEVASEYDLPFQLTSVGQSAQQALWVDDKASALINRAVLPVTGRVCWPIWSDGRAQPVQRDDTLTTPLFYATSSWRLHSSPA